MEILALLKIIRSVYVVRTENIRRKRLKPNIRLTAHSPAGVEVAMIEVNTTFLSNAFDRDMFDDSAQRKAGNVVAVRGILLYNCLISKD